MELVPRPVRTPVVQPRWAQRGMAMTQYEALLAIERVHGAEMIADHGLRGVGRLSAIEARLMEDARFGDARYREIVDRFVATVGIVQTRYGLR